MKLWILRPVADLPKVDDPWEPWYDATFGFVVRAKTEKEARVLADQKGGSENQNHETPWLNKKYTTCSELTPSGESEVIIEDRHFHFCVVWGGWQTER